MPIKCPYGIALYEGGKGGRGGGGGGGGSVNQLLSNSLINRGSKYYFSLSSK